MMARCPKCGGQLIRGEYPSCFCGYEDYAPIPLETAQREVAPSIVAAHSHIKFWDDQHIKAREVSREWARENRGRVKGYRDRYRARKALGLV